MRVMITGGGTGGHTSPALAIIEEIKNRDSRLEVQWAGCAGSIEERVCVAHSIPFRSVPVKGWPRGNRVKQLFAAMHLARGVIRSWFHLRKFKPQVVIGVGGYVSVPLMWTAQRMGIPTILHEQNKQLGMANALLAQKAYRILLSFPDTKGDFSEDRSEVVGNPVRAGFAAAPERSSACETLGFNPAIPVILVCGGSQGAQSINNAIKYVVQHAESEEFQLIWMTGAGDVTEAREAAKQAKAHVEVHAYIDDMVTACAAARLIVSRSGASTTAEIAQVGRASMLIPYPHATDNHQEKNARAFEEAGAAVVILDEHCFGERILGDIRKLLADPAQLDAMEDAARGIAKPVAVERIVEHVFEAAFGADGVNESQE
jgi:UDP-N-acetylglucosamine--N-acetylmuramyl-(pentapeptide) pyrophosphoryl-undecaprenol N-acetylglucosamine transferase